MNAEMAAMPNLIREPLVKLPDKEVIVVGTDHDPSGTELYAGRLQTERDIDFAYNGKDVHAILLDSFIPPDGYGQAIGFQENGIKPAFDLTVPDQQIDFQMWPYRYAAKHPGTTLIFGDPVNMLPNYFYVYLNNLDIPTGQKFEERLTKLIETYNRPAYEEVQRQIEHLQGEQEKADTIYFGAIGAALLGAGAVKLYKWAEDNPSLPRRQFLKRAAGFAALAAAGGGIWHHERSNIHKQSQEAIAKRNELIGDFPPIGSRDFGITRDEYVAQQNQYMRSLIRQAREITNDDRKSEKFQRVARFDKDAMTLTAVLRNAIAADVLSAPSDELVIRDTTEKARIAAVWGASHIIVPEDCSISYFLTNEQARRETITVLLTSMFVAAEQEYGVDARNVFMEQMRTFAKSYSFTSDGKVEKIQQLHPPILTELLGTSNLATPQKAPETPSGSPKEVDVRGQTDYTPPSGESGKDQSEKTDHVSPEIATDQRVRHLIETYGPHMHVQAYGTDSTEWGTLMFSRYKLHFFQDLVTVADKINPTDPKFSSRLAAAIAFFSKDFVPMPSPVMPGRFGLLQLSEKLLTEAQIPFSEAEVAKMPPYVQLDGVIEPYLQYHREAQMKNGRPHFDYNRLEDLCAVIMDPAIIGKGDLLPVLQPTSDVQRPFYDRVAAILRKHNYQFEDTGTGGVITVDDLAMAVRFYAEELGEKEADLH